MLIKNIKGLVQLREKAVSRLEGKEMKHLPIVEDAFLLIEGGRIANYRTMAELPQVHPEIDASGRYVLPAFIDSHTSGFLPQVVKRNLFYKILGID